MNLTRVICAACLAFLPVGCGTLNNSVYIFYYRMPEEPPADYQPPNYVYGGVKFDAMAARSAFSEEMDLLSRFFCLLFIADLPLSAAFDTLSLYSTVPATQRVAEQWRKSEDMKWADWDERGNQLPVNSAAPNAETESEAN